ncbi:histidine kinase, partial [Enterococcus faecium]|nr:histidine kinase [Enterococcus faecium]
QTFFENSKFSWKTTIIIIFVGSMFVIIVTQIFEASSIVLFLFLFFCTFLFENRLRDKFGIVLLFFLVVLMSGIIVNGVGNVYSLLTQSSIQKEIKQQIFDVYLSDLTVFFCLFFIRNRKMKPISFIGMILVMLVLYISNSFVVFVISVVFGESNQDYLIISLNVTVLSLLLSIAFLFYYVEIRKKNIETQIESKYLKHVYQLKQNEVTAIKESNEEIYKVKHDMKNQLLMIRHLYEKSAVEGNTYIGKLISN